MRSELSTQQKAVLAIFYTLSFIAGVLTPNVIVARKAVGMTESFCDANKNLCDLFHWEDDLGNKLSLPAYVSSNEYFLATATSLMGALIAAVIIMMTVYIPKDCLSKACKTQKNDVNPEESVLILPPASQSNYCCSLFKKFRDNVFPTGWDLYQLLITSISLIAGAAFAAWYTANLNSQVFSGKEGFPNAKPDELKQLADFGDSFYQTTTVLGIILGTVMNLVVSVGAISIAAGIKYWISTKSESGNIQEDENAADFEL